ncbi:MAG: response regulator [Marinoscillum sp.]
MSPTILIVEDDPGVRETVADLVTALDYEYTMASNGKEALDRLEMERADLIISDIMMPIMDGQQLLRILKSDKNLCTIPVLILTAKADLDTKIETYEMGADGYLVKPFDLKELSFKVKYLINIKENLIKDLANDTESEPEWKFILALHAYLESNIRNADIESVAQKLNLTKSGFYKKLKRYSNQPFQSYVHVYKLAKAKALIDSGKCDVSEAADRSGFENIDFFSESYHHQFGVAPKS